MPKLKDIYVPPLSPSGDSVSQPPVRLMPFGKHLKVELNKKSSASDEALFKASDTYEAMGLGTTSNGPPERHLLELLSVEDRQREAVDYMNTMSPVNQLWLLHVFNQQGYSAQIDGEYYDQRDKWTAAYSFNRMAIDTSSALVALTSQVWFDRMNQNESAVEISAGQSPLEFSGFQDMAYQARIRMPDEWQMLATPSRIAPNVVAAKDRKGIVKAAARVDKVPNNLNMRDIDVLNAYSRLSFMSRNRVFYRQTESETVASWLGQLEQHLKGEDIEYIRKAQTIDELLDRMDDILDANQAVTLERDDFSSIDEVAGLRDDPEGRALIQLAHLNGVREVLETTSGVNLSEITLQTQVRLLKYMSSRTKEEFSRLSGAAEKSKAEFGSTAAFYEAFLATEYGDDFGDKILTIAEHVPSDKLETVLRGLKQTREGIAGIAHWFSDVDAQFAATQQVAVSERVTDFIATIAATAEHGAIRVNVQPGEGDDGAEGRFMYTADTEQAIKDVSELAANIKKQDGILNDPDTVVTRVVVENDNFSRFRLLNPRLGTMVANIRPYGTRSRGDAQYEIGSHKKGVEASFGLLTNLHDPYGISPHADMRSFSLRFDREGHRPDVSALAPGRQATNQEGTVAADVASIFSFGDPNEPATRIGRAIAAGGRIRSRELGTPDSLNHNMLSDQSYGDADVFAALAQKVIDKLDAMAKTTSRRKLASVAHKLAGLRHHTDYQQAA